MKIVTGAKASQLKFSCTTGSVYPRAYEDRERPGNEDGYEVVLNPTTTTSSQAISVNSLHPTFQLVFQYTAIPIKVIVVNCTDSKRKQHDEYTKF